MIKKPDRTWIAIGIVGLSITLGVWHWQMNKRIDSLSDRIDDHCHQEQGEFQ